PTNETLARLAKEYQGWAAKQPAGDEAKPLPDNADEGQLKSSVGRQAITRLGCAGCHDIPGFEKAKPNGPPLVGWAKREHAFEGAEQLPRDAFAAQTTRATKVELEERAKELEAKKAPTAADKAQLQKVKQLQAKPWVAPEGKQPVE